MLMVMVLATAFAFAMTITVPIAIAIAVPLRLQKIMFEVPRPDPERQFAAQRGSRAADELESVRRTSAGVRFLA